MFYSIALNVANFDVWSSVYWCYVILSSKYFIFKRAEKGNWWLMFMVDFKSVFKKVEKAVTNEIILRFTWCAFVHLTVQGIFSTVCWQIEIYILQMWAKQVLKQPSDCVFMGITCKHGSYVPSLTHLALRHAHIHLTHTFPFTKISHIQHLVSWFSQKSLNRHILRQKCTNFDFATIPYKTWLYLVGRGFAVPHQNSTSLYGPFGLLVSAHGILAAWWYAWVRPMLSCSVCLCVCQSVTFVDSVETNKHIFKIFLPSGSHTTLVFPY